MRKLIFFLTFVIFFISGCSALRPTMSTESSTSGAYPYPGAEATSPQIQSQNAYPYPGISETPGLQVYATAGPLPTPVTGKGVITGRLLVKGKPAVNVILYLADITKDEKGVDRLAGFSRTNSPNAQVNLEGNFVFANITPGKYALILDTVQNAYLLHKPGEEVEWLFTVEAGQVLDLGTLDYDSLPLPNLP